MFVVGKPIAMTAEASDPDDLVARWRLESAEATQRFLRSLR